MDVARRGQVFDASYLLEGVQVDGENHMGVVKVKINVADKTISYKDFTDNYGTIQTKFSDTYKDGFNTGDNGAFEELDTDGKDYKLFIYKQEVPKNTATADIFDRVEILSGVKSVYASSTETKNVWKEVKKSDYDASSAQKKEDNGRYYVLENYQVLHTIRKRIIS